MSRTLRIKATKADNAALNTPHPKITAFTFTIEDDGSLALGEEWASHEESYTFGSTITVPPRVWQKALPWLRRQMLGMGLL